MGHNEISANTNRLVLYHYISATLVLSLSKNGEHLVKVLQDPT